MESAEVDRDLLEWNHDQYEVRRTAEIHASRPDWQLFRDGCPGGESPGEVGALPDRVLRWLRTVQGEVLLFSSGHFLQVLAVRWLWLEPAGGRFFMLSPASLTWHTIRTYEWRRTASVRVLKGYYRYGKASFNSQCAFNRTLSVHRCGGIRAGVGPLFLYEAFANPNGKERV
jgi:broad specificity phosphatase PhoE